MFKFITFPFFLLIFLNSNAFATTYKYLCRGDGSRVVLQFDESDKLVITNNQKLTNTEFKYTQNMLLFCSCASSVAVIIQRSQR